MIALTTENTACDAATTPAYGLRTPIMQHKKNVQNY